MTIGKHKGQPLAKMKTPYLMWLISNDHIRHKRWPLVLDILAELRSRFDSFEALLEELTIESVPKYWKTPEQENRRALEKAEKLKALEHRRAAEKQARLNVRREQIARQRQIVDGYYSVRSLPDDGSDLV